MSSQALVFLSHAGDEAPAARELAQLLRAVGLRTWLDVEDLQPGDTWMEAIERALTEADAFAIYVGRGGIARWADREVRLALTKNVRNPRFRVIPILGPSANPDVLTPFLSQHQWIDLRTEGHLPNRAAALIRGVLQQPLPQPGALPSDCPPFRGLQAFDTDNAILFYGRDREINELLDRLRSERFVAVVAASGSGKSSLVRAGLLPSLHRGRFQDPATATPGVWRTAVTRPGDDPFRELGSALVDLDPSLPVADRIAVLHACRQRLVEGIDGLHDCVVSLVPRGIRTLLVIDQFEELFTGPVTRQSQRRYIDSLLHASASGPDYPIHILIAIRADFYSKCWEHPELPRYVAGSQYALRPMSADQLREAIERPLGLAGATLEPGLLEALVKDVGDDPGSLPILQHALLQLWEARSGTALTHNPPCQHD